MFSRYMIALCFVFVIVFFLKLNVDLFMCSMYILIVFLFRFVLQLVFVRNVARRRCVSVFQVHSDCFPVLSCCNTS